MLTRSPSVNMTDYGCDLRIIIIDRLGDHVSHWKRMVEVYAEQSKVWASLSFSAKTSIHSLFGTKLIWFARPHVWSYCWHLHISTCSFEFEMCIQKFVKQFNSSANTIFQEFILFHRYGSVCIIDVPQRSPSAVPWWTMLWIFISLKHLPLMVTRALRSCLGSYANFFVDKGTTQCPPTLPAILRISE